MLLWSLGSLTHWYSSIWFNIFKRSKPFMEGKSDLLGSSRRFFDDKDWFISVSSLKCSFEVQINYCQAQGQTWNVKSKLKQDQKDLSNLPSYTVMNCCTIMFSLWRSKSNWIPTFNLPQLASTGLNLLFESWIAMQWCAHCEGQDPTELHPLTCLCPELRSSIGSGQVG